MKWPQPCRVYQVADINLVHPAATSAIARSKATLIEIVGWVLLGLNSAVNC